MKMTTHRYLFTLTKQELPLQVSETCKDYQYNGWYGRPTSYRPPHPPKGPNKPKMTKMWILGTLGAGVVYMMLVSYDTYSVVTLSALSLLILLSNILSHSFPVPVPQGPLLFMCISLCISLGPWGSQTTWGPTLMAFLEWQLPFVSAHESAWFRELVLVCMAGRLRFWWKSNRKAIVGPQCLFPKDQGIYIGKYT